MSDSSRMSFFRGNVIVPFGCQLGIRIHGFSTKEQANDNGKITYQVSLMKVGCGIHQKKVLLLPPKATSRGFFQP